MIQPRPRPKTATDIYQAGLQQKPGYFSYAGFRSLQLLSGTNSYFHITHAGEEQCEPGHYYDETRTEYHMHFIIRGKGMFQIEDTLHPVKQGEIFLVPAGRQNAYQADWEDPWHYIWVAFGGSRVWRFLESAGFTPDKLIRPAYAPTEQYYALIQGILDARNLTHANELKRMSGLYAVFSLLTRTRSMENAAGDQGFYSRNKHVNHAIQYIQSNYSTTNIVDIASYVGLNRSYLTTLFKKEMHISLQEYLIHYRMEIASRQLETTTRKIGEIAAAVGYDDLLSFSKAFHRVHGVGPRDYRKAFSEMGRRG